MSDEEEDESRRIYYERFEPEAESAGERDRDREFEFESGAEEVFEEDGDEDRAVRISPTDDFDALDGDRVIYQGHPSWIGFWRSITISVIALTAGVLTWESSGWILFGALLVTLAAYTFVGVERSMQLYLVTPKRVELISGLIAKSSREVRVRDIRAINVRKEGVPGLLGVGTVEFASAGSDGVDVAFPNVWRPHRLKAMVRRLQEKVEE